MTAPSGWEGILDKDEKILWQGRPDTAIIWGFAQFIPTVFGLVFSGFALFWMIAAAQSGGGFWMFGLLHFSIGILIGIVPPFWSIYRRKNTWYTLTNRRTIIASDLMLKGRRLKSYPITKTTSIELDHGDLSNIYFASITRRKKNGTYEVKIGFERITDGVKVFKMMRDIQAVPETEDSNK